MNHDMREWVADEAKKIRGEVMRLLFLKYNGDAPGSIMIPSDVGQDMWMEMITPYDELPEDAKQVYREDANHILSVLELGEPVERTIGS